MVRNHIGYACINNGFQNKGVCNRTLRQKTLEEKGYEYLSELILTNLDALDTIFRWNAEMAIVYTKCPAKCFLSILTWT